MVSEIEQIKQMSKQTKQKEPISPQIKEGIYARGIKMVVIIVLIILGTSVFLSEKVKL